MPEYLVGPRPGAAAGRHRAGPRGRRRQAPRLPLRARQAHAATGSRSSGPAARSSWSAAGCPARGPAAGASARCCSASTRATARCATSGASAAASASASSIAWPRCSQPLGRESSPFSGGGPPRGAVFCEPRLVAEVSFSEWTRDGRLRHPVYLGLREDKPAAEVVREDPPRRRDGARRDGRRRRRRRRPGG